MPTDDTIPTTAPSWFLEAVNSPRRDGETTLDGARIHYLQWGESEAGRPGLLFVHGGGAHAHWWDFIAPAFIANFNVAAIDLSGMGDSEHRDSYSGDQFARELIAVCDAADLGAEVFIVGHSFGGLATLKAGLQHAERVRGIVVCDSAIFPPGFNPGNDMRVSPFKERRIYPDFETALSRFKLVPPQPCDNPFILDYIARHSLTEVEDGWSWKFDVRFLQKTIYDDMANHVRDLQVPAAVIYGENSMLFGKSMLKTTRSYYAEDVPFIALPAARHHLFLDQPLAFIETLREVLDGWTRRAAA